VPGIADCLELSLWKANSDRWKITLVEKIRTATANKARGFGAARSMQLQAAV